MFLKKLLRFTYKSLINLSFKIYFLSNTLLVKSRSIALKINSFANKLLYGDKLINKNFNYSYLDKRIKNNFNIDFFENISSKNEEYQLRFITPLFPYTICDHFLSQELDKNSKYFMYTDIKIKGNDLLKNKNIYKIQNFDIVLVQVDFFELFQDTILPYLKKNNIKIILITCQSHFPALTKSLRTDNCISHPSIILWISQNPIYYNIKNYLAIPYGLDHRYLTEYINYLKKSNIKLINKRTNIANLYSSPHPYHLPGNHIRSKYKEILCDYRKKLSYNDYLKEILHSKFLISPTGDREDCYRHYEAIGLGTIPISNASKNYYKSIFKSNMIFLKEKKIISIINSLSENLKYSSPDRNILLNSYWINKINKKINKLIISTIEKDV